MPSNSFSMTEEGDNATKSAATTDDILERMKLTHPGDKELLTQLVPWIQTQRPRFMYTSILGLAVLIQRMGRAFSMRSSAPVTSKYAAIKKPGPTNPVVSSTSTAPTASQSSGTAPPTSASGSTPGTTQRLPPKPKKKAFRSAKKLDLSPNVVASLKGFVADLAATLPLILEHVEHQQRRSLKGVPQLTAVDTIEVCLHMMEGEVATNQPSNSGKSLPNAAMELYRKILDRATSNKNPNGSQDGAASTMDQLKFKTFCTKTLESAQSRTLAVVESLHDFRLLWNISHAQHSVGFVPRAGNSQQQEELAWKLAYYIVWKRQEEHPELCTRRERILSAATSMVILCLFPLLHRHSEAQASENSEQPKPESFTNANNKRPVEDGSVTSSPATKVLRLASSGDIHQGNKSAGGTKIFNASCERCIRQERTLEVVLHAAKQASSFVNWAQRKKAIREGGEQSEAKESGADLERKELDQELQKVVDDLFTFSDFEKKPSSSSNWIECLKSALGMKNSDEALSLDAVEENLVALLDYAFNAMQRGEDERMGTRVEAVPYIEELALMAEVRKGFVNHLCKTTNDRQNERNELIACVPVTSPSHLDTKTAQGRGSDSANISEYQAKAVRPRLLMMADTHDSFITPNRAASPPVISEPMELNEWTVAILSSLSRIKPTRKLRSLLEQAASDDKTTPSCMTNIIAPLLNRFLGRMHQASGGGSRGAMSMTVNAEGEVRTHHRTPDTQLWAAIVQLYFHSLESVLFFEKGAANSAAVKSAPFHEALMACCYLCIARAVTITGKIQLVQPENHHVYSILPLVGSTPYTYLKVTESFLRALSATVPGNETSKQLMDRFGTLPRILQQEVRDSEVHVLESLLWVRDSSRTMEGCIVNTIAELKQVDLWPPECLEPTFPEEAEDEAASAKKEGQTLNHPEFEFVSFVMRKLLKIAYFRIKSLCKALGIPSDYPVASQVWLAFRFLLRNQVELLYGRHLDQWILVSIVGVSRTMKYRPGITFGKAVEKYVCVREGELGATVCAAIVRQVKILDAAGDGDANDNDQSYGSTKMGNIINLYNLVFVPIMKSYLLHSKTLKRNARALRTAEEVTAKNESTKKAAISKTVCEGNVVVQVTLGSAGAGEASDKTTTTAAMMMDQNDITKNGSSFLQFGRVSGEKRISLANEMMKVLQ